MLHPLHDRKTNTNTSKIIEVFEKKCIHDRIEADEICSIFNKAFSNNNF